MTDWPLRTLGELCLQMTVGFVGKMADQYVDSGVPFLRSQDIMAGRIDVSRLKYISPEFHARIRKSRLVPGDVGIVRTGYPGTAAVVPETLREANCSDLVIARTGPDLDPRYLAFLLNSPWGKSMIRGRLVGAAQQHFNVKVAHALQVPTPPIEEQRRVASILGAYDDLIEVNRLRVAVVEEMARGLFEEWFVRFRFPGHEGVAVVDTPAGPLPQGWAWKPFSTLARFANGFAFKPSDFQSDGLPIVKIPELKAGVLSKTPRNSGRDVPAHLHLQTGDLLFSWSGTFAISEWTWGDALLNQHLFLVTPTGALSRGFIKQALIHALPRFDSQGVGATMKHIRRAALDTTYVPIPTHIGLISQANVLLQSCYDQTVVIKRQGQALGASRDLLLSRLISGQLSVSAAERQLEEAA